MTQRAIYLDNAATTRVDDAVMSEVRACMQVEFGNPASAHFLGIGAEKRVAAAGRELASALGDAGSDAGDLVWTSGGTEADALGVIGAARARKRRGAHIIISALEHPAVRESAALLANEGWRVTTVPATKTGAIDPARVAEAVADDTQVVAVMLVQNEIGTVMPMADIAAAVRAKPAGKDVHIHCDAVQALGKIPLAVPALGVDSVAVSAHKIHGPKGAGALWLRKKARLTPLWAGGGQQQGRRSGTLNVPGIVGLGKAAALATETLFAHTERYQQFRETLLAAARNSGIETRENGAEAERSPHIVSLAFRNIPAEPLLHVLESRGVLVSAGSACAERDRKPSPVLAAIGLDAGWGTLRFSFGHDTTLEDINTAAEILADALRSF